VVAARQDGLGGRLASMINAMRVADVLDLPFRFVWPRVRHDHGFNAISAAEDMFSTAFIERHQRQVIDGANYISIMDVPITTAHLKQLNKDPQIHGLLIDTWEAPVPIAGVADAEDFSAAQLFERIEFSPRMREVVTAAARAIPVDDCVALHVRGGDLVYGQNRLRLFNEKYSPYALVKQVVVRLGEIGRRVIVFSDDERTQRGLEQKFGLLLASELVEREFVEPDRRALFEILLMSRCKEIIAANSAFATVAGFLGQARLRNLREYAGLILTQQAILEDLEHASSDYSPVEAAKSYQYVAIELKAVLSSAERHTLLGKAIALDPDNTTYYHLRAGEALEQDDVATADAVLGVGAERYFATSGRGHVDLANAVQRLSAFAPLLKTYSERHDAPYVCAYHSHFTLASKSAEQALPFAQRAHESRRDSVLLLARYAHVLIAAKHYDTARALLEAAVGDHADVPVLHSLLAEVLDAQQLPERAVEAARRAHVLLPADIMTSIKFGLVCERNGQREEALQCANALSLGEEAPAHVLYQYGRLLSNVGELARAVRVLEQVVRLSPQKPHYVARYRSVKAKFERAEASRAKKAAELASR